MDRRYLRKMSSALLVPALLTMMGCGRSENVGWGDDEADASGSVAEQQAGIQDTAEGSPAAGDRGGQAQGPGAASGEMQEAQALMREYQSLSQSLEPVQEQAMADPEIRAGWDSLDADVRERMLAENPAMGQLFQRAEQIQARVAQAEQSGEELGQEERAQLAQQWQSIQSTLSQARAQVYRSPEFVDRLDSLRDEVYTRMRQLEPGRTEDIDRMQTISERLVAMFDSVSGEAPTPQ
jgi:hypothetical protein